MNDSFERDLFRARAKSIELPPLPPVDVVIARGEARRRVRAVSLLPVGTLARVSTAFAKMAGPVAMLHAAAGIFVLVAWGSGARVERVRPDVAPSEHATMSLNEPEARASGVNNKDDRETCEALPASMPLAVGDLRDRAASCDGFTQENAGPASAGVMTSAGDAICGELVTCADDRP